MICNHCGAEIEEIVIEYNADIRSSYELDREAGVFKLINQDTLGDRESIISCCNCGKSLSDEVRELLIIE